MLVMTGDVIQGLCFLVKEALGASSVAVCCSNEAIMTRIIFDSVHRDIRSTDTVAVSIAYYVVHST